MKTNKIFTIAFVGMMTLTACESKLDIEQKGVISTKDYYMTDDEAETAVTNVYASFKNVLTDYLMVKNSLSDDCFAGGRGMAIDEVNEFLFTSDNSSIASLFQEYYSIVYAANMVINNVEPNTQAKARAVAEAKFFRGWTNFELVTLWGTAPLITEAERDDYRVSNSTTEELWAQVEQDLSEAISSGALPEKSGVDDKDTPMRVTKQTAQAMLGKAYLFQGKYCEAAAQLDAVINSGKYAMMPLSDNGYLGYSQTSNDNHSESLLQVNRLNDASVYSMELTCMYLGMPVNRMDGYMNEKSPFYSEAWGFCSAAKESLINAFENNAAKNGVDDVRYLTTLYSMERLEENFGLSVKKGSFFECCVGYFLTKYASLTENHIPMTWAGFMQNTVLMRYAEVLLMAAEAHFQSGDTAKALAYINIIREHAGEPLATTVTLSDIKLEKQLELCNEGVRFQDLVRWGDAYEVLKDEGKVIGYYGYMDGTGVPSVTYPVQQADAGFKKGKNELLPFPYAEMNVNPNITQNSGY